MRVEDIDIDALIAITKQAVYNLRQVIDKELSTNNEFKDDIKPAVKEMLLSLTHDTICSQVTLILGINTDSKKEYSYMREDLDSKVSEFTYGKISLDDLIRFIQNLYVQLLTIESEDLDRRSKAVLERKTIMIGRQCIGH